MKNRPLVAIIVVSCNTRELLKDCLQAVCENTKGLASEVLVVDNASTDGSPEMVAVEFPSVKLIRNRQNVGFARANNQGIKESNSDFVLLLNSDTVVQPAAIERMLEAMSIDEKIGLVGCRLLNPDRSLQPSLRTFPNYLVHTIEITELYRWLPANGLIGHFYPFKSDHCQSRAIDWVSGACMLIRRKAIEQVGLLDEGYFMYAEEMDWSFRMRKFGWLTYFTPRAEVIHIGGGSSKTNREKLIIEQYRSLFRFYRKHYSPFRLLLLRVLVASLTLTKVLLLALLENRGSKRRNLKGAYLQLIDLSLRGNGEA